MKSGSVGFSMHTLMVLSSDCTGNTIAPVTNSFGMSLLTVSMYS